MELDLSDQDLTYLKTKAKKLRATAGDPLTHAEALEQIARQQGARDWNTLRARVLRPTRFAPGTRVRGQYLGQSFQGRVHTLDGSDGPDRMRLVLHFDTPVDVVTFDSFSALRQRVGATIGRTGRSFDTTSDGQPHLIVGRAYD